VKAYLTICGLLLFASSCDPYALKPLDIQTVKNGDIVAQWFMTSSISSVHNHVGIKTPKGWEQVLETDGNGYKIYDVLIDKDTVIVQLCEGTHVYEMESYFWGTYVRVDSSISEYQYHQKFSQKVGGKTE
jgi:hypothetical protein